MQIGQEVESSFARATEHHWLRQEDAIAIDPETRFQSRCFDFGFVPCGSKKSQPLLVDKLKPCTDDLRHRFNSTKDLGGGILILEHDRCGTVMGRDLAHDGKFVDGVLLQGVRLEAKQSCKCE